MKMNPYHKRFLENFTSENVIALFSRYKGAAKEITESWAMFEAAKMITYKSNIDLNECMVVIVGDGCSPRTGAIFAYYTKAFVFSIDPNANLKHWEEHCEKQTLMGYTPKRIEFWKNTVEEISPIVYTANEKVIVVWPHSHADMNKLKMEGYSRRIDIAMPCCVKIPSNWMAKPHITYTDFNVLSPKRDIHIWEDICAYTKPGTQTVSVK